jgi:excisionase family DNA binding protein
MVDRAGATGQSGDAGYLTMGEAAGRLGISKPTLRRALYRGALPLAYRTPGGYVRFRPADVEAYACHLAGPHETADSGATAPPGQVRPRSHARDAETPLPAPPWPAVPGRGESR